MAGHEVTDQQIEQLRTESGRAGDLDMAAACDRALRGSRRARAECADEIAAAAAMIEEDVEPYG